MWETPNLSPPPSPPHPPPPRKKIIIKKCGNKRTCGVVPNTNKMNPNRPPLLPQHSKRKRPSYKRARRLRALTKEGGRERERETREKRDERARECARPHRRGRGLTLVSFVTGVCHPDAWTLGEKSRGCVLLEDLRTSWWRTEHEGIMVGISFAFFFSPVWLACFLAYALRDPWVFAAVFLFLGEWVSEWEEVGTLCVCIQKWYPVGLFFVPRLRIWWGAAICCCCSAAASVVMWGCRKWQSLLER